MARPIFRKFTRWVLYKRKDVVRKLHALGFGLSEPGGRHFYVRYEEHTLTIPNNPEFSIPQLKMLLKQVEKILERKISLEEWQRL
jgi:predicted RNA binding protein YcfA (HicA-like mRNA interferase family)